jgi:predicted GNAT family acetyltransferase
MIKLKESERFRLLEYLSTEPEVNMFFIGVIENHRLDSDEVAVYAEENLEKDGWSLVALRFYDNYILYGRDETYKVDAIIDFLKADVVDTINGKASIIRRIAPFFPHMKAEEKAVFRLDSVKEPVPDNRKVKVRLLKPEDAGLMVDLYAQNLEYGANFFGNKEKYVAERRNNLEGGGLAVGLIVKMKLVSVAELTADNEFTGLITGIATHPKYYGKGFATHAVTALCSEAFRRGKKHICVFDENPKIRKLLKKVGFEEKNHYGVLH